MTLLLGIIVLNTDAGSSASYTIETEVWGGGGGLINSGAVVVNGTVGQSAVGVSSSPSYSMETGYWHSGGTVPVTLQQFSVE